MILNKIKLENIRSYNNIELNFPKGNILLSGNIGSGKTSLLLAIDFVLFGLRKGVLSGASLLRKGEEKGSVELHFNIDEKKVIVKRTLRRNKTGITQDFGFISIDGENFEGTAIQIKQKILELFNYSLDSLTKSKSLVYNYTVYTPQEEMKSILLADPQERLIILRKIFGIDKYQRIRDNSKILISHLKFKLKEMEIKIISLVDKINERDENKAKIRVNEGSLEILNSKMKEISIKISEIKKQIDLIIDQKTKREKIKKELEGLNNSIKYLVETRIKNSKEIEELKIEIASLEQEIKNYNENGDNISKTILDYEEDLRKNEVLSKELNKKINELDLKIRESSKNKQDVINLDYCIYCKQKVDQAHKNKIIHIEDLKIKENSHNLSKAKDSLEDVQEIIKKIKFDLDKLNKKRSEFNLYLFKKESFDKKANKLDIMLTDQKRLKLEIGNLNAKSLELNEIIDSIPNVDMKYKESSNLLESCYAEEKILISEKGQLENEIKMLKSRVDVLSIEIIKLEFIKKQIIGYSKLISFLEGEFVNMVLTMEKMIMAKVHSDFDNLFKEWFKLLVNDENIKISLDSEFTPQIQQNGYDSDYLHLSGGEKTSAALAYRLALNQVINTIMSEINTKDLLILDEPTDGFSEEQVDKIRTILEQIGIEQVIIVSHDPKIESFVDHIFRFEKINNLSRVVN